MSRRWLCGGAWRRALLGLAMGLVVALAHAAPVALNPEQARHLLLRTGFAPTQSEVDAITGQSAMQAVADLIARARAAQPRRAPPEFVRLPPPIPLNQLPSREEQQAARLQQLREGLELKTWWVGEMLDTPTPLAERMTLFWHGLFATSLQKVVRSQAMWAQHQLFRRQALGNFRQLVHAVARDPAMLVYLDGASSRREAPNENFAREVMELFVLGEASQGGGYTEQDIREAARAFTGWSVERSDFSFRYRPALHDPGVKTLFGQSGRFDGDQALDLILDQPAAARHLVERLWQEFVSPQPDAAQVSVLAQRVRERQFDIGSLLQDLLLSDAFWAPQQPGSLVKSPLELVVGTVRQFGFRYTDPMPFAIKAAQLGQNLLVPPNVKGWPGYTDWINASTLLERKRFTEQLFRAVEIRGEGPDRPIEMGPGGRTAEPLMEAGAGALPGSFTRTFGGSGVRPLLAVLRRDGVMRVADGMSRVSFDPQQWLQTYGGHADREPDVALARHLAAQVLAVPPTRQPQPGMVGVAWLRALTQDPAYQLK